MALTKTEEHRSKYSRHTCALSKISLCLGLQSQLLKICSPYLPKSNSNSFSEVQLDCTKTVKILSEKPKMSTTSKLKLKKTSTNKRQHSHPKLIRIICLRKYAYHHLKMPKTQKIAQTNCLKKVRSTRRNKSFQPSLKTNQLTPKQPFSPKLINVSPKMQTMIALSGSNFIIWQKNSSD